MTFAQAAAFKFRPGSLEGLVAFVLAPLAELAPDLRHPMMGAEISELLRALADTGDVRGWRRPPGWPGSRLDGVEGRQGG